MTSEQVKSLASSLGFDACGITRAERLPEAEEELKAWVREGKHGEMKYLEDFESRANRFWRNFPGARSIIVVGVNYYAKGQKGDRLLGPERPSNLSPFCDTSLTGGMTKQSARRHSESRPPAEGGSASGGKGGTKNLDSEILRPFGPQEDTGCDVASLTKRHGGPAMTEERSTGRVARYAWGKDYHRVIGKRLEEFREKLSEAVGRPFRAEICVDTKPLHERALAQRAGLGFIGKQSQLLSPKFGPWLFLAELVTDLELEPDIPFVGSCGSCRICIDECPTEAILPEGGIDARCCIAYLTIEHKTEIPPSLRPLIGDWVFGCDLCLQVCPHASKSKETGWPELRAESGKGEALDLLSLLQIPSNGAYEKEFEGTAITRAHRKQLLRNARVILENLDEEEIEDRTRAVERVA